MQGVVGAKGAIAVPMVVGTVEIAIVLLGLIVADADQPNVGGLGHGSLEYLHAIIS